jgi:hypothetical protein
MVGREGLEWAFRKSSSPIVQMALPLGKEEANLQFSPIDVALKNLIE